MIEKVFKVGDTITIKRTSQAGTGYRYALVRLTGGVALVEELSEDADTPGGTSVQSFIFRFLQPGQVEIQFAYYRDSEFSKAPYYRVRFLRSNHPIREYIFVKHFFRVTVIGGFGEFRPLTDQEKEIFRTCMTLKGVDYTPLLVAEQLVSGYNYRFICMTESLIREPKYGFAKVTIYAPLRGEPILESIIEC